MKKIFISILSAAMFAACAKTETEDVIPVNPEPEDEAQTVYVEIGATTGSNTKATYDENLKAYWEAGDQILAVQGHACDWKAGGNDKTIQANPLDLNSGELTNSAIFAGTIDTQSSDAKYFHFAYPATNTELYTHGNINMWGTSNTQTSTCTYTVPSEQDGKWTPFLCTSTTEKTTATNITNIDFGTSLNACLAVRVFYHDGKTPKPVKRIRITSGNNIVGTISATTANDGAFSAGMFASAGGGTEINADNLHTIAKLGNNYEYRFEVLPVDAGVLTVELVDAAGSKIIRQTNPKTFKANTRSGVNVVWDDATISIDDKPLTWYDDYAKNGFSDMGANSVYVKGAKIRGVGIENVKVIGVRLRKLTDDGQETGDENIKYYPNSDLSSLSSDENGTLSFDSQLDNIPSGNYYVRPYAIIINSDGAEQEIISTVHTAIVTSIPTITSHTIRSSYNNNGAVAKNNDLDGDKIYTTVSLNDTFAAVNLIESATLHYGGNTLAIDAKGSEFSTESIAYQQYSNCYAEIVFTNGYTLKTQEYDINVTGVPYRITTDSANPNGWETSNTTTSNKKLLIKDGGYILSPAFFASSNCSYEVTASAQVYCYKGSLISATYTLSMQTDPVGSAYLSENLSGGTNTGDSSSKSIYPHLDTYTKIKISSTKVKTSGFSSINYGIRVHSFSVEYN